MPLLFGVDAGSLVLPLLDPRDLLFLVLPEELPVPVSEVDCDSLAFWLVFGDELGLLLDFDLPLD